jgi:D-glycero-D-manno-heptose 1,7-bisphosphate phosphatase
VNYLAMKTAKQQKALFLDRDGTINIEKEYVYKIEDFEFQPGIFDLLRKYKKEGYLIFIITNQSGIARGLYSENEYLQLTDWMIREFEKEEIRIEKVYYCPHHPDFTGDCNCRKPKPGLLLDAIKTYHIDPAKSVLIGDLEAGRRAGIGKNVYIQPLLKKGIFKTDNSR